MSDPAKTKTSALRALPAVDQLIRLQDPSHLGIFGVERITALARRVIDEMRTEIQALENQGQTVSNSREACLAEAIKRLESACESDSLAGLRRVINATGVILHTNLGRAPLSPAAREAIVREAAGYCTLEYDATSGSRGKRGERVEDLLKQLTGAEDALVVNNCASAALLVLTALAHDGDTLVSRGELVEIGGDFRVPDVLANSGTRMVEVGTTNRTRLDDYKRAINENTRLIIRIHPSNYRIVGFTASPTLTELASLAHEAGLVLYEDAGSGVLEDLSDQGLGDEPIIRNCVAEGADVVSFSGDKLLGSAQAGLIVGSAEIIGRLRKHSLYRALRADKLCLAALEATLKAHARGTATAEIPALRMLSMTAQEIETRASRLVGILSRELDGSGLTASLIGGESAIGGGSGPNTHPATVLIALTHEKLSADEIESRLRRFSPPIIGRIADDKVLLDLRTVEVEAEEELLWALRSLGS
jgi:L-seryl-tRNA(Ser) seleniumtransferase